MSGLALRQRVRKLIKRLTCHGILLKAFRKTTQEARANFLNAIADEIEALGDELIRTYCAESGLPEGRAQGERGRNNVSTALICRNAWK